jgi:hypothetical protein
MRALQIHGIAGGLKGEKINISYERKGFEECNVNRIYVQKSR